MAFISKSWHSPTTSMIILDLGKHISPSVYVSYSIINSLFYSMFVYMYPVVIFEIIFKKSCQNIITQQISPFLVLSEFHKNFIFRHNSKKFKVNSALLRNTGHLYFYLYFNIQHFSFSWKNEMYSYKKHSSIRLGQQVIKKCQISSHCDSSLTVINIFLLNDLLLFCIRMACW